MSNDVSDDPRTGGAGDSVEHTSPRALEDFLAAADSAARQLADSPPTERAAWLHAGADMLADHKADLARLADSETALGISRLEGEVVRTASPMRSYAQVAVKAAYLGAVIDAATATTPSIRRIDVPLEPVAAFGASNFPFALRVAGVLEGVDPL